MGRYIVSVWHGEGGSIAEVRDTLDPDACLGIYSTAGVGATFYADARRKADELNAACVGDAMGDGYPGTRYFHDSPACPGHA